MIRYGMAAGFVALVACAGFVASPASAQTKELATATQHAGLAAKATDLKGVQMHLHHVINCLVGPSGAGFDASFGNPCNGQGNGAIPATMVVAKRKPLETALDQAKDGAQQSNLSVALLDANLAQSTLSGKAKPSKAGMKKAAMKKTMPATMSHPM
jgi:hypothetical protein